MARTKSSTSKTRASSQKTVAKKPRKRAAKAVSESALDDEESSPDADDEELPKDEAGRLKIKRQYEELLGIRIDKLKGRVLNRERINKTIEGIYFICAECRKICHNLDEGLVEDPDNERNLCQACAEPKQPRGKRSRKKKTAAA